MKKIFYLAIFLCASCTTQKEALINSQINIQDLKNRKVKESITNTYMVEYDYPTGIYRYNQLRPKVDEPVAFEIQNINRLAYNVSIKSRDSILSQSYIEDDIIKFLEDYVNREKSKETKPESDVDVNEIPVAGSEEIAVEVKDSQEQVIKDLEASKELGKKIGVLEQELETLNLALKNQEALLDENQELKNKIEEKQKELDSVKTKAQELKTRAIQSSDLKAQYYSNFQDFHQTFAEVREVYRQVQGVQSISDEIANIATNPFLTHEIFQKVHSENLMRYNRDLPDFVILNKHFQELYSTLKMKYADLKADQNALDSILHRSGRFLFMLNIDQIKNTADEMNTKVINLKVDDLVRNSRRVYELLNSSHNYRFISTPIQPKYDVALFDVKINKRVENKYKVHNNKEFKHAEFTRHGLRFDVSVGAGVSMHDNKYNLSLQNDKSGNQKIVMSEDPVVTPSFLGFFTTSYRSATHTTFGVSAGIGISADQGTFTFDNFFVGPSLIVGRYERVMLTAGPSLKSLPRLNEFYKDGDLVESQLNLGNVTSEAYRLGWFISLSYNLTKGVKDNIRRINGGK